MVLSETWFVEGQIDFEMQRYRLLAYLREVDACFKESRLYPQLSDLVFHYNNLIAFRKNKQFLQEQFPKKLDDISLEKTKLIYEQMLADDELMLELEAITSYAKNKIKPLLDTGASLYEAVEKSMVVSPVGINPPYNSEGYLLLRWGSSTEIWAYSYSVTLFENEKSRYRGLKTEYLNAWPHNYINTPEYIKKELVRSNSSLRNPAVYEVVTDLKLPVVETILPVARRLFIRFLATST